MKRKEVLNSKFKQLLIDNHKNGLINFGMKLSGVSLTSQIELLIDSRIHYNSQKGTEICLELMDAKNYLIQSTADCGSFSKAFFDFLTDTDSNINDVKPQKSFAILKSKIIGSKTDYPYIIQISIPGHQYSILVTHQEDKRPQGQIYQSNTHSDMNDEKFSIYNWLESENNITIDVVNHLDEIEELFNNKGKNKQKIFEKFYSIPIMESKAPIKNCKNLDKLIKAFSQQEIRWLIGKVNYEHAILRLEKLHVTCLQEINSLKKFFGIKLESNFIDEFSNKLNRDEILLDFDFEEMFQKYISTNNRSSLEEKVKGRKKDRNLYEEYSSLLNLSITFQKSTPKLKIVKTSKCGHDQDIENYFRNFE